MKEAKMNLFRSKIGLLYIYFSFRIVFFSKKTVRFFKRLKKKDFEIMSGNQPKSTKLGVLDFSMTGLYHKIGSFQFSMSTLTPKFM